MKKNLLRSAGLLVMAVFLAVYGCSTQREGVVTTAGETKKVPERSEIDTKYLWNLTTVFPNVQAWEGEFAEVETTVSQVAKLKGTLSEGPAKLLHALKFTDDLEARLDRAFVYASLLADQNTRDGDNQALRSRAVSLYYKYIREASWMQPELAAIPQETIWGWMGDNEPLAVYGQFFDDLFRQREYILSEREEELLALAGEVRGAPRRAYSLLANADLRFPSIEDENGDTVELTDSSFYIFMRNPDRRVRQAAYRGIVGAYADFRNTAGALYNGAVQSDILSVKARGYDSCLAAALHGENIPVGVYNTLVHTVNDNLHLLHRYQEIRQRALNLEDGVHAYDLFAPLITEQEYQVEYEEAVETIITALEPLGLEYLKPMKKGFASRWVDVFATKGKRSGAYSSGTYLTQPFILTNFHGGYEDMSTVAHEMGHSMHSFFSRGTQPYVYSQYSIFCAEVASTCNEVLLQNYVLAHTEDPKVKLHLLGEFLETIRGTVFRQTMFSEFEQRAHEMAEQGLPLTADSLSAEYGKIMKKYYGPAYVHDELVDNYWIRIPHFYRSFYVYKYATSYCAASNLANRISRGEPGAVKAYMSFLKGGSSQYPIDLLKMAGVDMTKPDPIVDCMKLFENLLDQTEELLAQVNE